ncbi:MAG: hypothetical protein DCC58_02400 [Chloroflexi bacterium]|nr:MAG: hypothetical protein DCC58_02400 [Chloroflexota bacterium]
MADAAQRFLDSLTDAQRATATFPFAGDERYFWHYTPVERNGLMLGDMTGHQQELAFALLASGLSARGAAEARQIVDLEPILREVERVEQRPTQWLRDSARYWFSVFGTPGGRDPWAWRAGGHHIGVSFSIFDGDYVAPTPLFFGANPATVPFGPHAGMRTLAGEEDLARVLLGSLDAAQKAVAIVDPVAPADILTVNYRSADPAVLPSGLPYSDLTGEQRGRLVALVRQYVGRAADEVQAGQWRRIEAAGFDGLAFAWAGPETPGVGHYYTVKGPHFLIEYDNTQNDANHIHAVWRDFSNDWGEDLLAAHYAGAHQHGDHHHTHAHSHPADNEWSDQ